MPDLDPDEQPSLELPKLGLRRRRRSRAVPPAPVDAEPVETSPVETVADETVADEPAPVPSPTPRRRELRVRRPGGLVVVLVTGALVGLAVVGLTWASLQTCEEVQGTPSCGKTGYPMLGVVLLVSIVAGGVLLRLGRVRDPVSTSFLGVGLAAVIALLFLVDRLDQPAMVVVIPVITAATFGVAHWVTITFIEPGERPR